MKLYVYAKEIGLNEDYWQVNGIIGIWTKLDKFLEYINDQRKQMVDNRFKESLEKLEFIDVEKIFDKETWWNGEYYVTEIESNVELDRLDYDSFVGGLNTSLNEKDFLSQYELWSPTMKEILDHNEKIRIALEKEEDKKKKAQEQKEKTLYNKLKEKYGC
jgi:hypothetical protein